MYMLFVLSGGSGGVVVLFSIDYFYLYYSLMKSRCKKGFRWDTIATAIVFWYEVCGFRQANLYLPT